MKLIVGLGNPGREYYNTRHNIGFDIIDYYLSYYDLNNLNNKFNGIYIKTKVKNQDIIFLKPQKYMNLSGEVVLPFANYFKIKTENILIIRDDLDLKLGTIRLKENSSSGGHNGIKNIEKCLSTNNYKQLKIGISNDKNKETKDYVLSKFSNEEKNILDPIIKDSLNIINDFIEFDDFRLLTNKYNKR